MVTLPILSPAGEAVGTLELSSDVFGVATHHALLHQAVLATQANQRQGSADTKTRGEVKHTTRKLYRQKGTGRARQGMRSAPHWKGGGVVFGPHPRDFSQSFNKKMRRKAMLCAISSRILDNGIVVVDSFGITEAKTRAGLQLLRALGLDGVPKMLVVFDTYSDEAARAFRNLPTVEITTADQLCTYDVLCADRILFTRASIERFAELKSQPVGPRRLAIATDEGGAA